MYTTQVRKPSWPLRALVWYYRRPLVGYVILFGIALYCGFAPRSGEVIVFNVVVLPWLLIALGFLNLPFLAALNRKFRLTEDERRNHALEHGTIRVLCTQRGYRKIGGAAHSRGFRIWGAKREDIPDAFAAVVATEQEARWPIVISRSCGSTTVFTQGLAIALMLVCIIAFIFLRPPASAVALVLLLELAAFLLIRYPLALALQRRRLLSVNFTSARIVQIEKAQPVIGLETPPVYIVHTEVI